VQDAAQPRLQWRWGRPRHAAADTRGPRCVTSSLPGSSRGCGEASAPQLFVCVLGRLLRYHPAALPARGADAERLSVHRLGNGAELGRGYHEGSPQLYLRHGEPGRRFEEEEEGRRRPGRPRPAADVVGTRCHYLLAVAACFARRSQASQFSTPQGNAYRLDAHGAFSRRPVDNRYATVTPSASKNQQRRR
jgi:hypothetical protein